VTVVREALSSGAITDDDDFGSEGKCISCSTEIILPSSYAPNCSVLLFLSEKLGYGYKCNYEALSTCLWSLHRLENSEDLIWRRALTAFTCGGTLSEEH
jgi:hypothetical protein